MNTYKAGDNSASNNTGSQAELLIQLEKLLYFVTSEGMIDDMQAVPEFRARIRSLCGRTPEAARNLASTILELTNTSITQSSTRRNKVVKDLTYRPPRSARILDQVVSDKNKERRTPSETPLASPPLLASLDLVPALLVKSSSALSSPKTPCETPLASPLLPASLVESSSALSSPKTDMSMIERDGRISPNPSTISSLPRPLPSSLSVEIPRLADMITGAVRIIHQLCKYQHELPREVYSRILLTLHGDHELPGMASSNDWSDGAMWMRVLEAGESRTHRTTIFNMLEYMGAREWYDQQIKLAQRVVYTQKNRLVEHKGAAIHVLDKIQAKSVRGVGQITTEEGDIKPDILPEQASTTELTNLVQRSHIRMRLNRGYKLKEKLVKGLGFGILFSPKIWQYTKMSMESLDVLVRGIQADAKQIHLLDILGQQLVLLINGQPDLNGLLDSLKAEALVSEEDYRELKLNFPLETDAMPNGFLDTAVDSLIEDVSSKVLGKPVPSPEDDVTIDGKAEISCVTFNKLRAGEWLDNWMVFAGIQMSDKPYFVKYGQSIPLDERFGRTGMRRVHRPLARWKKTIEAQPQHGQNTLVHFCPLNINGDHFTLLEINERRSVIYHYNSMASQGVIDGRVKQTHVGKIVEEEFGHFKFDYIEAATPQQRDTSSCGPMVIRNARLRMNGLSVGGWDDRLDTDRLRMELVETFRTCILDNAIRKRPLTISRQDGSVEEFQEPGEDILRKRLKIGGGDA